MLTLNVEAQYRLSESECRGRPNRTHYYSEARVSISVYDLTQPLTFTQGTRGYERGGNVAADGRCD